MTTTCKRIRRIRVNSNLDKNLQRILRTHMGVKPLSLSLPISEMNLSKDYRSIAQEVSDCGGYTGHCSCLNNACMMCTAFH